MDVSAPSARPPAITIGEKWSRYGPGVLPAWVADMDLGVAEPIRMALADTLERNDLGYPSSQLLERVVAAFVQWSRTRHGLEVDPELVVVTSEVVQAVYLAVMTLTAPGDAVVVQTPAYPPFFRAVAETGRRLVEHPLKDSATKYLMDLDDLQNVVRKERARMLICCNPHNPTGRVLSSEELTGLARIALEEDVILVVDEIHSDLVHKGYKHIPMAALGQDIAERTVSLTSASKAFNIAGLRCAVALFGSQELLSCFKAIPSHARGGLSSLGLLATAVAWEQGEPWLNWVTAQLAQRRDLVARRVAADLNGVRLHPPEGGYLAWLDCTQSGLGPDPARFFLEHALVALSPGLDFGVVGAGHARLNFATTAPLLDSILSRMASAMSAGR